jgi:hypothetical protein
VTQPWLTDLHSPCHGHAINCAQRGIGSNTIVDVTPLRLVVCADMKDTLHLWSSAQNRLAHNLRCTPEPMDDSLCNHPDESFLLKQESHAQAA